MSQKNKDKKKTKSTTTTSFQDRLHQSASTPSASTAPFTPTSFFDKHIGSPDSDNLGTGAFSSPTPIKIPEHIKSSPSYLAHQHPIKRKRGTAESDDDWQGLLERVKAKSQKLESGGSGKQGTPNDVDNDSDANSKILKTEEGSDHRAGDNDLLDGNHEAVENGLLGDTYKGARKKDNDETEAERLASNNSGSSSSSGSSSTSSTSGSSDSEDNDTVHATSEPAETDTESAGEASPSKRLKRKHPTASSDDAPANKRRSSVVTRNPPPPELEGRFKFNNSIVGSNIYRYPKAVLDILTPLKRLIPPSVITYVQNNPCKETAKFMKKHSEDNDNTYRMLVTLQSAQHMIPHLAIERLIGTAEPMDEEMAGELMRIAKKRGEEVDRLNLQLAHLRSEMEELREKTSKKRG